jgi:hypothetical protein
MFGHLKSEDFVNLLEGVELSPKHRNHIEACAQCHATWESMRSVQVGISSLETDIPEPDWLQFRSAVRDDLLSRSIQRQTAVRRWTGWSIRPAVAWALSLMMAVGITTAALLWKIDERRVDPVPPSIERRTPPIEPTAEVMESGPEKSLFDDLVSLGDEEQEQFRRMLESAQK